MSHQPTSATTSLLPGLATAAGIACGASVASHALATTGLPISPSILALLAGLALAPRLRRDHLAPGFAWASRTGLRLGVALLGCRIGLGELRALGPSTWLGLTLGVGVTLLGVRWLARRAGLSDELAWLLAVGHAICGAAAVAATDAIVRGKPRDATTAIALVTLLGTLSMLLLPAACRLLDCAPSTAGHVAGAALHEVAQAVAAGYALGDECGAVATVVKLARVALLMPVTVLIAASRPRAGNAVAVPWFVVGFALCVLLAPGLPAVVVESAQSASTALLATAMAGLGLRTALRDLHEAGARTLLVALAATLLVTALAVAQAAWLQ